jgi:exodeoxyribonuclease-3
MAAARSNAKRAMKLISWNVNGIRSVLRKGFLDFLAARRPDVLCLQETRAAPADVGGLRLPGYLQYWNAAAKRGYAGTAIFTRPRPMAVTPGLGMARHDREGRVLTAEYRTFYLVNVYTPNSKRDLSRLAYREAWDRAFFRYLKRLEKKKPVVFCGDLNVAHEEIDLTYPKANRKNHGFTDEERRGFRRLVQGGFMDTFREFHKEGGHYTWWSRMHNARKRNIGWRIDYFGISAALRPKLRAAGILAGVRGSDHAPVTAEISVR